MRISKQDRELARELRDILDLTERDEKMLAVTLWSHRQLAADDQQAETRPLVEACGALLAGAEKYSVKITSSPMSFRCLKPAGHDWDHDSGSYVWSRTCGIVSPESSNPCVLDRGHLVVEGENSHRTADGRWFG